MHGNIEKIINWRGRLELQCPTEGCELVQCTHVMAVYWEKDPTEGDRKRVRMEVRCEDGHGFFLIIKNHAGTSYFEWELLENIRSPFGEDQSW